MSLEDSAKRVAEFVKLAEKATPGPWTRPNDAVELGGMGISSVNSIVIGGCGCCGSPYGDNEDDDSAFIASSRQMPSDFAEIVREARILAERLQDHIDGEYSANCEEALEFLRLTAPIVGEEGQG